MSNTKIFNSCVDRLKKEGKKIEDAVHACSRILNNSTRARLGKLEVSTNNSSKGWVILIIILILILLGFYSILNFFPKLF